MPLSGLPFVVTDLADRLQDATGWHANPELPCLSGFWVHALTEEGQQRLLVAPHRRRFLREELARHLDLAEVDFALQPVPDIDDSFDYGILADVVVIAATSAETGRVADAADPEDAEVLYCLDLRPITCGLTWGRARNGLVSSRLLTQRCEPRCPTGYHVVIVGGIPVRGAEGFDLQVQPGSVVAVEFVALPSPAGTPMLPVDHTPGSDSDSSSSDSDTSGRPDGAGSSHSRSPDASVRFVEMHAGTHSDPDNVDACSRIRLEGAATPGRLHATAAWSSRLKPGGGLAAKILWLCLAAACGDAGTAVQLFPTAIESRGRDPPAIAHHDTLVIPGASCVAGRDTTIQPCCGRDRVRTAGRTCSHTLSDSSSCP